MSNTIRNILRTTFGIRDGEVFRVLLMQLNIFLLISTLLIVKPTVNGIFLSKLGIEALPIAFMLVAFFAAITSNIYARFLGRINLVRIILWTLSISIVLFLLFAILLGLEVVEGWILYVFYIWVAIFAVLTSSQFWILANVVFNAREAKRLFGFIGAGAIAGGIFGGYLTTALAEPLGSSNLLFVGAGLLLFCIPITIYIWKHKVLSTQTKFQRRKKIARVTNPLRLILSSRHLTFLAGIVGISVIVAKLVDYQFNAIAANKIADPDELTAFFGFWFSNFNVISLALQIFLTRRVVGTLGVGTSLFFLPGGILLGALLLLIVPELWVAIFIKMSDGSLKQSINKAAVELLALPIPSEIKNQTKTFIDVFIDSVATGISGIILIFVVNALDLSPQIINLMIIGLIALWFYFILKVREEYLASFRLKIGEGRDGKQLEKIKEPLIDKWKRVLHGGTEKQLLSALKKIREQPDERFWEDIKLLLQHPSPEVVEVAINNLYFFKQAVALDEIESLVKAPAQNVKVAAIEYLIEHYPSFALQQITQYLNDPDVDLQVAALISLAKESRDNPTLKVGFNLEKRLKEHLLGVDLIQDPVQKKAYIIGMLKAMGFAKMPSFFPPIEGFLKHQNRSIQIQAILSAGETLNPYFIPLLIEFLGNPVLKEDARTALVNFGPEIVKSLSEFMEGEDAVPLEILQAIPSVIGKFGTQEAINVLFKLIQSSEPAVNMAALRALTQLKKKHPHLDLIKSKGILHYIHQEAQWYQSTLSILYAQIKQHEVLRPVLAQKDKVAKDRHHLINLLEKRLDQHLERIFRWLGLKYPPEDIYIIYKGIQSKQPDLRVNALEFLDNLLDPNLKKVLIPIIETALLDSVSEEAIQHMNLKIPTEKECFQVLLKRGDNPLKMATLRLIATMGDKAYVAMVGHAYEQEKGAIKDLAMEVLSTLVAR